MKYKVQAHHLQAVHWT